MGFDFLSNEVNDVLEICEKAQKKVDDYIAQLGKPISNKEKDALAEKFVREELDEFQKKNKVNISFNQVTETLDSEQIIDEDENEFDDLELDEMMDVWDEEDGDF